MSTIEMIALVNLVSNENSAYHQLIFYIISCSTMSWFTEQKNNISFMLPFFKTSYNNYCLSGLLCIAYLRLYLLICIAWNKINIYLYIIYLLLFKNIYYFFCSRLGTVVRKNLNSIFDSIKILCCTLVIHVSAVFTTSSYLPSYLPPHLLTAQTL